MMDEGRQLARFEDELIVDILEALKLSLSVSPGGSFAEGLLNNSDIDTMWEICSNMYVILHQGDKLPSNKQMKPLLIDMENCHVGYTRLKLLADWDYQSEPGDELLYSIQNNELFASGTKFISWFGDEKFFSEEMRTVTRYGPALQFLLCKTWFSLTSDIFQRDAFRNYSDKISLELLKEKGFHLVFTSHSDSLNRETEFRFSFSVIEKYLMRFWTK